MYRKINKKLKIYRNILRFINFLTKLIVIINLALFFYFLQKNINNNDLKNNNIISNVVEKPKLQTYESDGDIILMIGDKAEILDNKIKVYNLKVKSDLLDGSADIVDIINNGEEIIFRDRPVVLFYNRPPA